MSIEVPEHLRTGPLADAAARALQDAASMASSSNSIPRLSLKGREFRLIIGGDEVAKFRDKLNVIIIGVEPEQGRMIKTFYKSGYTSGVQEPPTCSSDDGIAPAPWVNDKQAQTCQQCPKNAFGSATSPNGKPTKACRDSKRIWFKLAEGNKVQKGDALVEYEEGLKPFADRTLFGANVTVASLKAFSDHGRTLAALGQGPAVCVTQLVMLDMEYPQMDFKLHAWLDAVTAPLSLELAEKRPWKIQFKNAGLALSMGDGAGNQSRAALPMQVPDHLKPQSQATQVVEEVAQQAKPTPTAGSIDDAVSNW